MKSLPATRGVLAAMRGPGGRKASSLTRPTSMVPPCPGGPTRRSLRPPLAARNGTPQERHTSARARLAGRMVPIRPGRAR